MAQTLRVCGFSFSCASGAQTWEGLRHPAVTRTLHALPLGRALKALPTTSSPSHCTVSVSFIVCVKLVEPEA